MVAVAALPLVFWLPTWFTPGKSILAVPSNKTPPIVLAFANWVAVAALPLSVAAVIVPLPIFNDVLSVFHWTSDLL